MRCENISKPSLTYSDERHELLSQDHLGFFWLSSALSYYNNTRDHLIILQIFQPMTAQLHPIKSVCSNIIAFSFCLLKWSHIVGSSPGLFSIFQRSSSRCLIFGNVNTVFPRIVSAETVPFWDWNIYRISANNFRPWIVSAHVICMYCEQRSHYIRLNSKKNSFRGNYSRIYGS